MRIVIDTNVVISGIFFGGFPRKVLEASVYGNVVACATPEIVSEYEEIVNEMLDRKQGTIRRDILAPFIEALDFTDVKTQIAICRDPDDDKFISCAVDSRALYIVSGDKDLLSIEEYKGIEIITAADFCRKYL